MLQELHIQNFAIIDDVHLSFSEGFNVITGETGAGKSILIDAVNVVLGSQADKDFVRAGAERAIIEAVFTVPEHAKPLINRIFDTEEIEYETLDEVVITREVRKNGRSTSRINGTTTKTSVIKEIAALLINIHGQNDNAALMKPKEHIYILDRYAHLENTRDTLGELVRELNDVRRSIKRLQQDEATLARRVEMLEYQVEELTSADLRPDEEEELRQESNRLANYEKLYDLIISASALLDGDDRQEGGAITMLEEASVFVSRAAMLDPNLKEAAELAELVSVQAEELADSLRRYLDAMDVTPGQLDRIEARLALIASLKRKYSALNIPELLAYLKKAQEELANISNSEAHIVELQQKEHELLIKIGEVSLTLSTQRKTAADRLAKAVEEELSQLRMENARFEVNITNYEDPEGCFINNKRYAFDMNGIDQVEFLISTNFGEPLKPLAKVASGGEASRTMLALINALSQADQTPTMIFDEIDQGIGGRLGAVIGEKLWRISQNHQVLCITHLAQLASFADVHFRVMKDVIDDRTVTHVTQLDPAQKLLELAEMLGPEASSARQNARDLLVIAQQTKAAPKIKQ
ncbi:MAG: DNA repair protein RecN [Phototrophicales bacterium]|nr:MAG: DNA repair protein RecN [Phototrophicales bacterium]